MGAAALPIAMGMMAVGTGVSMYGQYQQGKQAEKIGKYNAQVDLMRAEQMAKNAAFAKQKEGLERQNAVDASQILADKRDQWVAKMKGKAAAGNIRVNLGVPLVIEAEGRENFAKDITKVLRIGAQKAGEWKMQGMNYQSQASTLRTSAAIEEQVGKNARRNSIWSMIGTGASGLGSMAFMGYNAGMWGGGGGGTGLSMYNNTHAGNYMNMNP